MVLGRSITSKILSGCRIFHPPSVAWRTQANQLLSSHFHTGGRSDEDWAEDGHDSLSRRKNFDKKKKDPQEKLSQPLTPTFKLGNVASSRDNSRRQLRVANLIRESLQGIIAESLPMREAILRSVGVSISSVEMTKDLRTAFVNWETWPTPKEAKMAAINGKLNGSSAYLRHELAAMGAFRHTPELVFKYDDKSLKSEHIQKLFEITKTQREKERLRQAMMATSSPSKTADP